MTLGPSLIGLLESAAVLVGESVGVRDSVGFAVNWYDDEEDGACVDVTARARCGCESTVTYYLDRGSLHPHGTVRCARHTPVAAPQPWPEGVPF